MRLPPIPPRDLTSEQKSLCDEMKAGIADLYQGIQSETEGGALIGPFNPWLHDPKVGKAIWELNKVVSAKRTLPDTAREIVILVVGARFKTVYETYAHMILAQKSGVSQTKLSTIMAGSRPGDLSEEEACAYDVASALCAGGVLLQPCYDQALRLFGRGGVNELVYLVGTYLFACVTMNGFDVPVPEPV